MGNTTVDDAIWIEMRSRAAIIARTLPDVASDKRLSVVEAAQRLGVDRSTVFRWRARFEVERRLSVIMAQTHQRAKSMR